MFWTLELEEFLQDVNANKLRKCWPESCFPWKRYVSEDLNWEKISFNFNLKVSTHFARKWKKKHQISERITSFLGRSALWCNRRKTCLWKPLPDFCMVNIPKAITLHQVNYSIGHTHKVQMFAPENSNHEAVNCTVHLRNFCKLVLYRKKYFAFWINTPIKDDRWLPWTDGILSANRQSN